MRIIVHPKLLPVMTAGSIIVFLSTDYVQTGPYNKAYTESQLQAGGGFVLPDFNEEQVTALKTVIERTNA